MFIKARFDFGVAHMNRDGEPVLFSRAGIR